MQPGQIGHLVGDLAGQAGIAGHLKLGKLIYLYDNNHISLGGATGLIFTEDVAKRFDAYGWHTRPVADGNDTAEIAAAMRITLSDYERLIYEIKPVSFVCLDSVQDSETGSETSRYESIPDEGQPDPVETASNRELSAVIAERRSGDTLSRIAQVFGVSVSDLVNWNGISAHTTLRPGAGVVTSRGDVHYVITEHGVAYLHGKTIRQRAEAMIAIADPKFQAELEDHALKNKLLTASRSVVAV